MTVFAGLIIQITCGLVVLRWAAGRNALKAVADVITQFLNYAAVGAEAVFGKNYSNHRFAMLVRMSFCKRV